MEGKREGSNLKTHFAVLKKAIDSLSPKKSYICTHISRPGGMILAKESFVSEIYICEYCEKKEHYTPFVDPANSTNRTWLCANPHCIVNSDLKGLKMTPNTNPPKRSLLWVSFCELWAIGDKHYDVKFESIEQNPAKQLFLLKFAKNPEGIALMRGDTGTGKTYCAMAVCEFFTRSSISAVYISQKKLATKWLDSNKINDSYNNFIDQLNSCRLLVIDDFGTVELRGGFMSFFMDLIDSRLQYKNKGTIITTNLTREIFNEVCGDALSDRLQTGTILDYKGKTRRTKTIL